MSSLSKEEDGRYISIEDARFRIDMVGVRQDTHILSKRIYAPDGTIERIEASITDLVNTSDFNAVLQGDDLVLTTTVRRRANDRDALAEAEQITAGSGKAGAIDRPRRIGRR